MPASQRPGLAQAHSSRSSTTGTEEDSKPLQRNDSSDRLHTRGSNAHLPKYNHSRKHLVGHRQQGRIPSIGKNLNRLAQLATDEELALAVKERHHGRSRSHDPSLQSVADIVAARRKSRDPSQLKRVSSDFSQPTPHRKSLEEVPAARAAKMESTAESDDIQQSKFELDADDQEAGWTETSDSQSPADSRVTTKSHTPTHTTFAAAHPELSDTSDPNLAERTRPVHSQRSADQNPDALRNISTHNFNKKSTTSQGLLPRGHAHNAEPQLTSFSAVRTLGDGQLQTPGSEASTNPNTLVPSYENISKFIGSHGGSLAALSSSRASPTSGQISKKDNITSQQRARSHQASPGPQNPSPSDPRNLNGLSLNYAQPQIPSRTQQKLWLQRARSNIEPQQPIGSPHSMGNLRSAGSGLSVGHGIGGLGAGYGDGRDPRLQKEIDRSAREYMIICRYRKALPVPTQSQISSRRRSRLQPGQPETPRQANDESNRAREANLRGNDGASRSNRAFQEIGQEDVDAYQNGEAQNSQVGVDRILQRFWDRVEINGSD
jgi:hypothetical protein